METRQNKLLLSRAGVASEIDALANMAIQMCGALHPADQGPSRDHYRRIQAVLKQVASSYFGGAKPKAFIVMVEQEMQCPVDPKCKGMIGMTGAERQGPEDYEHQLQCLGCAEKWWASA